MSSKPSMPPSQESPTKEHLRLVEPFSGAVAPWRKWGPYVSERSWGSVREDYSPDGCAWEFLPHDWARSKAYRWGEDGIAGICDRYQLLVFAMAFWNGRDPILKERMFGLSGNEGVHGEDVKEYWFYLDSTPTHSYMRMLYKYPQREYPYAELIEKNRRNRPGGEYELLDTGILTTTATGIFPSSMRRRTPKMSAFVLKLSIAGRKKPSCICFRIFGSAIRGRGTMHHGKSP